MSHDPYHPKILLLEAPRHTIIGNEIHRIYRYSDLDVDTDPDPHGSDPGQFGSPTRS